MPEADGNLSLDTSTLDDGAHNVSVVVYDATGMNSATFGPVPVEIQNRPAPMASNPAITESSSRTAARLVLSRRSAKALLHRRFGRSTTLTGRLVDAEGKPLQQAALSVFSASTVPGAQPRPLGTAKTDDSGRFKFELPPGPSRRIVVQSSTLGVVAEVLLSVAAPIRLLPSRERLRNKQKLVLTAYLLGARAPARSANVAFQVRIGDRWRTFATRPITSKGRARVEHRFKVTYQRLTYRFRAVVVGRRDFPYANAVSPPAAVTVN
jgi:hypothetical protein